MDPQVKLHYRRMASFLDTAPIFDYYNAVTLLTIEHTRREYHEKNT